MVNVVGAREKVGSLVVQQSGIQCFNCKEFGHFAKECRKPKRVKDSAYHKEKMLLCKQADYMAKIQEVPTADSGTDSEPVEQVQIDVGYNVFANHLQHSEQSESVSNTYLVETDDSNVILDSPDMCEDDIQNDQNDVESDDERIALVNLIANLKLDVDENKKIQKQLKKANTTLSQEMKECKAIFVETIKSLGESISVRDSCLVALQTKQTEFDKYKAFNDRTVDYDKLERMLNEALGQLAHKDTVIREGLKTKAYELSVVKEKHDELMKQSLLTKLHYEGLVKQKTMVITDLKLREEHDTEKMLSMEKQLKFLNEVVYKRSQSIQTIHMMAPKVSTYNGRPTFANPRYLKQAQSEGFHTHNDSFRFVHELKHEMHADLKYVESIEKAIDELESDKAEFLDMYDVILQDCVSKDVMCSYLMSFSDLDALDELQCLYLHKKNIRFLLKLLCKSVKNSELKKLIEKGKGKSMDTKFDKPSVIRQPNAQRILKPSVLAGSESRPPMLNKENYVPWSSRLLRYAKSRPNGKLIHNSILNGPYVRRMIPKPGDAERDVNVNETFHEQTDDELSERELKQIEADDQAIQTILIGLPEDIYAAVDSCETAQEIWLRVH
nr:hypothetical protein [Tanacetum cinerariifolium]